MHEMARPGIEAANGRSVRHPGSGLAVDEDSDLYCIGAGPLPGTNRKCHTTFCVSKRLNPFLKDDHEENKDQMAQQTAET